MLFMGRLKKKRKALAPSLRFEIVAESFRRYADGREVCLDTKKGQDEYKRRTMEMHDRQRGVCGRGEHRIIAPTFDHADTRGLGGARRDDRIVDSEGKWMNCCSCWLCNCRAGSTRIAGQRA